MHIITEQNTNVNYVNLGHCSVLVISKKLVNGLLNVEKNDAFKTGWKIVVWHMET